MSGRPHSELQRDPSPDRYSTVKVLKTIIFDEINSATKRREKKEKSFICYEDLKRIWSDQSRISTLLQPDCLSKDQIDLIQRKMILILSTLISVEATECLASFRARFFDPNSGNPLVTDDAIPFERNQLFFLDSEPALRESFYDHQFRFKPVVINITKSHKTLVIKNQMQRLPFEYRQKDIGSGGYGKVDLVGISPRYIRGEFDSIWETVYEVACKKVKLPKDFDQEVDNLQILKESLTRHDRIMLHLATIEHGPNRYILLPYAQYGDLELFFHCGRGPDKKQKYDFDMCFNEVRNGNVTLSLLRQCWSLANALEWLHTGITIEKNSSTVFCAHMDLKPANILIEPSTESAVGKWMISDFGISVLKEEAKQQDTEIVSIYDYYSQLTMNTRPKRQEGTYQAPEVKLAESVSNQQSHLTPDQKGIGRKSDIWSYGCIFSEVLAFALGKDKFVSEFQAARKGCEGSDYFYVEKTGKGYLMALYQVHPSVLKWLEGLCGNAIIPQRLVDCYVETIKKVLIVDTAKRPDATELTKLVNHVKEHLDNTQVNCSLLRAKDEAGAQRTPIPLREDLNAMSCSDQTSLPARSDYIVKEVLHDVEFSGKNSVRPKDDLSLDHIISVASTASSGTNSSVSTTFAKPAGTHGIMIDRDVSRTLKGNIYKPLPKMEGSNFKATSIALTYSGSEGEVRAAYLAKLSVFFYRLNVEEMSASFEQEVKLPQSDGWQGIAVAGYFLAAWGFSSTKMLHLCDIREPQRRINLPSSCNIEMLERVVVSKQGAAALLCTQTILVIKIDTQTPSPPLCAPADQRFTDVAFNDTGDLLFAWAYGQKNSLYVWRCQDCVVSQKTEFESHYKTEKKGRPYQTRVIPYNTHPGCIIATPNKRFFPAQVRSSPRRNSETQSHSHEIIISDAKAVCIFHNHSMITVEKDFYGSYLKEYKIEDDSNPFIRKPGEKICKLETGQDESSRFLVFKYRENIIIIVCNLHCMVEFVRICV